MLDKKISISAQALAAITHFRFFIVVPPYFQSVRTISFPFFLPISHIHMCSISLIIFENSD